MKFSEKTIKNIPLGIRKIILWGVVIILGIALIYFWTKISIQRLRQAWHPEELSKELKIPSLKEKLSKGIPEFKKLESLLDILLTPQPQEEINPSTFSFPNIK